MKDSHAMQCNAAPYAKCGQRLTVTCSKMPKQSSLKSRAQIKCLKKMLFRGACIPNADRQNFRVPDEYLAISMSRIFQTLTRELLDANV
jgi:hypothetical protein